MRQRIDARGKTLRAFRAYLELQLTADWIRKEMRGQLGSFDRTMAGFRVLEMLYRGMPALLEQELRKIRRAWPFDGRVAPELLARRLHSGFWTPHRGTLSA